MPILTKMIVGELVIIILFITSIIILLLCVYYWRIYYYNYITSDRQDSAWTFLSALCVIVALCTGIFMLVEFVDWSIIVRWWNIEL